MCDVCETSLFNYHWACKKCGFVVCIDCYKARKYGENKVWNSEWNNASDRDEYQWLLCTNNTIHNQETLMLTQIIAGDSLQILGQRIHHFRSLWKIPQNCACLMSRESSKSNDDIRKELIQSILNDSKLNRFDQMDFGSSDSETNLNREKYDLNKSLRILDQSTDEDELTHDNKTSSCSAKPQEGQPSDLTEFKFEDDSSEEGENHSTLRDLLIGPTTKSNSNCLVKEEKELDVADETEKIAKKLKKTREQLFHEMMANTLEPIKKKEENEDLMSNQPRRNRYLPIRVMTMAYSQELYPNVNHMWLCEGKLLRLLDPVDPKNLKIFQQQWKRGQPVIVSHVDKCLNMDIWRPESFSRDFGEDANDLINCLTGALVPNQPMKREHYL